VGEAVFKKTCFACHNTPGMGAPLFGNKTDWAPRIAKGKDTLYKHALEGFTSPGGMMPMLPRGGNPALDDASVKAAVDYMVAHSQ
jgi:cytochrome c5